MRQRTENGNKKWESKLILYLIIYFMIGSYIMSIPTVEDCQDKLSIVEGEEIYDVCFYYCGEQEDRHNCEWIPIESYNTKKEAEVALKYEIEKCNEGVWYDFFGFSKLSKGTIILLSILIPIVLLLITREIITKELIKYYNLF